MDWAWTHPEGCALEGRSEIAFSAGVGLGWPVNPTLSGLTAEGDLVSTMALRKLNLTLHLVDRVKSLDFARQEAAKEQEGVLRESGVCMKKG